MLNQNPCSAADVIIQFTNEIYEVGESDEAGQACVEIASGHIIARSIPFSIQSVLTEEATAEGRVF